MKAIRLLNVKGAPNKGSSKIYEWSLGNQEELCEKLQESCMREPAKKGICFKDSNLMEYHKRNKKKILKRELRKTGRSFERSSKESSLREQAYEK